MSAELLRRAAALMRERAEPLVEIRDTCADAGIAHYERQIKRHGGGPLFKAHFASWHPTVALAVADWLEDEAKSAENWDRLGAGVDQLETLCGPAFDVARAYLGVAADE